MRPIVKYRIIRRPVHQRGASLLFAMMALVVLALAGSALVRSVDTGTLIMGNLSFKQDALAASSSGSELAMTWLQNNVTTAVIDNDAPASGYYAASRDDLDVTGGKTSATNKLNLVDWDGNCQGYTTDVRDQCNVTAAPAVTVNGNRVQWIITRICDVTGAPSGSNLCMRPASTSTSTASDRGELASGGRISATTASPYYRIVVRVEGARNTVSYTETLVHF